MQENQGPKIEPPHGFIEDDPGYRMLWVRGRLALLDQLANEHWRRLHNHIIVEELEWSDRCTEIEQCRLRTLSGEQLVRRKARREQNARRKAVNQ
jgi:hypothetical protein